MVFALRGVILPKDASTAANVGYNLDHICTTQAGDPSECVTGGLDGGLAPVVDVNSTGVDNAFGSLFYQLVDVGLGLPINPVYNVYPDDPAFGKMPFQQVARAYQDAGFGTFVVVIEGWNGKPNDASVTVSIVQAAGGTPCSDVGSVEFAPTQNYGDPPDPNNPFPGRLVLKADHKQLAPKPTWQPNTDCWFIRPDSYQDSTNPSAGAKLSDSAAYVANNLLYLKLPDGQNIYFFAGPVAALVKLTGSIATSEIVDGGAAGMDVLVTGRWSQADVRATAPYVGVCPPSSPLDTGLYGQLDAQLAKSLDVLVSPTYTPSDLPCKAMSLGVEFQSAVRGQLAKDTNGQQILSGNPSCSLPNACCDPSNPADMSNPCPGIVCGLLPDNRLNPYRTYPDGGMPMQDGGVDGG